MIFNSYSKKKINVVIFTIRQIENLEIVPKIK